MALPYITEEELLELLEEHPEGLTLAGLATKTHRGFPAGIIGRLIREGKIITTGHVGEGSTPSIWGYKHRISAAEWLRRQRKSTGG
jgi:hypothetical protein